MTVRLNTGKFERKLLNKVERGMRKATLFTLSAAQEKVRQPGSGELYQKTASVTHRASRPGEPPATDTGRLLDSLTSDVKVRAGDVTGLVMAQTEYAAALELGTDKMAARPFLRPSVTENKLKILRMVAQG